jgi:hypothetical protein
MASKPVKLQRPGKGHCVQSLLADKLVLHRYVARVPVSAAGQNRQKSVGSTLACFASTLACVARAFAGNRPGFATFGTGETEWQLIAKPRL